MIPQHVIGAKELWKKLVMHYCCCSPHPNITCGFLILLKLEQDLPKRSWVSHVHHLLNGDEVCIVGIALLCDVGESYTMFLAFNLTFTHYKICRCKNAKFMSSLDLQLGVENFRLAYCFGIPMGHVDVHVPWILY